MNTLLLLIGILVVGLMVGYWFGARRAGRQWSCLFDEYLRSGAAVRAAKSLMALKTFRAGDAARGLRLLEQEVDAAQEFAARSQCAGAAIRRGTRSGRV